MHGENYPLWIKRARNKLLKLQTDEPEIYPPINDITPPTPDPQDPGPDLTTAVARPSAGPICPPESRCQPTPGAPKTQSSRPIRTHKIPKHLSDFELDSYQLVLSISSLVMEEQNFVPDYDYEEGDSGSLKTPAAPRSRKNKWLRTCPGCDDKYPHLKRHSLCNHLSFYTDPILTCWNCEKVQLQPNRTFQHLAAHVNGRFNHERLFSWYYLM